MQRGLPWPSSFWLPITQTRSSLYADATLIGDAAGIQDLYIERLHFESSGKTVSFSVDSGVATRLVLQQSC